MIAAPAARSRGPMRACASRPWCSPRDGAGGPAAPRRSLRIGDATFLDRVGRAAGAARAWTGWSVVLGHDAARVRAEAALPAGVHGGRERSLRGRDARLGPGRPRRRGGGRRGRRPPPSRGPSAGRARRPWTAWSRPSARARGSRCRATAAGAAIPGGFARGAWAALRAAPPSEGARFVLASHPDWIVHVDGRPRLRGRHRHARGLPAAHRRLTARGVPECSVRAARRALI